MHSPTPLPRLLAIVLSLALAPLTWAANSAIEPVPRNDAWVKRHEGFVEIAQKGGVDVLFLGDSITDAWRKPAAKEGGLEIFDREFGPLHPANFGISGDRTQHVLWRLDNGEAKGIQPKAVVLMIGTNNIGFEADKVTPRNTVPEVVEGVTAVVKNLQSKFPKAKILLLAIFPRSEKDSLVRQQVNEANRGIAKLHDGQRVVFLDIGQKFLEPDGTLPKTLMPDLLHPNTRGYEIWAAAIKTPLADLMK